MIVPYQTEILDASADSLQPEGQQAVLGQNRVTVETSPPWYGRTMMIAGSILSVSMIGVYFEDRSFSNESEFFSPPSKASYMTAASIFAGVAALGYFTTRRRGRVSMTSPTGAFSGTLNMGKVGDLTLDDMIAQIPDPAGARPGSDTFRFRHTIPEDASLPSHRLSRTDDQTEIAWRLPSSQPTQEQPPAQQRPSEPPEQEPAQQQDPSPASASSFVHGAPQPNAYAFIVGIEEYRSVTSTPGSRADAEGFAQMVETTLGVPHQNIHVLTDENATRSDILATLSWMERNVSADGRIYFFFSGHGSPNVETGQSFLLPYEGQPETIEFSGIALQDVLDGLERTPAREVVAFVDACFSGSGDRSALPEGARPLVPVQEASAEGGSKLALIASSGASEISGTTADGDRGLFTHYLLQALGEGRADMDGDGMISLDELHSYITPRVARDARRLNREQTPTVSVADGLGESSSVMLLWGLPRN